MGKILRSRRALAAILIVIVAVSVTGLSTYQVMNNQRFAQQSFILGLVLFQMGQPRIVSMAPHIDEILLGLGLEEYIVGCTNHDPYGLGYKMGDFYLPRLVELILSGKIYNGIDWWAPSVEDVVNLNPNIVLLDSGVTSQVSMYHSLISQGIFSFLVSQGTRISEIEESILQIGILFKRSSMAQALVDKMETKINTIQGNVSNQTVPNVLMCVWIDFDQQTVLTCGGNTFLSEIIQKAGGLNIFYHSNLSWPTLPMAEAAARNPSKIIILDHNAFLDPIETLTNLGDTPLAGTDAYTSGEVYFIQGQADNLLTRPGPRVAEGVELLANMLFPALFNATFDYPHILNTINYKGYLDSFILE